MTTEFNLSYTRTSDKLREAKCLELDSERAPRCPRRTHQGHSTWDTPPNEVWGMGVHRPTRAGRGYSMDIESKTTKLEIRTISTNMVESRTHLPHLERHPKEPDKGDIDSEYNDAVSRDIVNLCSIEKALLNDRERQHSECETKKLDDLPASHKPPPNALTHAPTTFMDPRRHGRIRTSAERVSGTHTSQIAYLTHVVPLWLLCGTEGTYLECTMAIPSPRTSKKTCPNKEDQVGERETSLQLQETRRPPPERDRMALGLSREKGCWYDDTVSSRFVESRRIEKSMLAGSGSRHRERKAKCRNGLPVPPETPLNGCTHPPETYRVLRRCGRLKSKAESISSNQTR
ncbi:hypothetical protein EDD16DRAFT_1531985 [Pisolithus croceorrhizus]|nr:hypothetical protein EDD16DRAFT_1531985 [Pisolithus croceorrhizus]